MTSQIQSGTKLDEQILALYLARHRKNYAASAPLNYDKEKDDLVLLDCIALLLVVDDKGDVAAVAMNQLPAAVHFYFSKNSPCSPSLTSIHNAH